MSSGQPGLQSEFQDSQDYTEKLCLKKKKSKTKKNCLLCSILDIASHVYDLNSFIPISIAQCLTCFAEKTFLLLETERTNIVFTNNAKYNNSFERRNKSLQFEVIRVGVK